MRKMFAAAALATTLAAHGSQEAMQQALNTWQHQVAAYEEALKAADDDSMRAAIEPPDARSIAPQLWQSINARTGTRAATKGKGRIPTFEFEKPWALPAIVWILEHPQAFTAAFTDEEQPQLTYFGNAIVDSLSRVHFSSPGVGAVCPSLSTTSSVREYEILQKIYQRNQHKSARACAALGMSLMLNNPMVSSVEGSVSMARAKRLYYLKQSILLSDKNTLFGNRPVTEVALEQAYYLRHLDTGCIAPQVTVRDQEGAEHRFPITGKPNLFIFWSPADPAGAAMVRDIDKIRAQYPGVEIVPIMPHATPEEQQEALQALGIDTSYTDTANGAAGITYRINQLPTVALISRKSTILYGGAPDIKLQNALDAIAAEEDAAAKATRPKVYIKESPGAPAQPAEAPAPAPADTNDVPALREIPEF